MRPFSLYIRPSICLSVLRLFNPIFLASIRSVLFVRPSVRLSVRLSVCMSVCPVLLMSIRQSVCPSVRLSTGPSTYPPSHASVHLSVRPFVGPSFNQSIRTFNPPSARSSITPFADVIKVKKDVITPLVRLRHPIDGAQATSVVRRIAFSASLGVNGTSFVQK